MDPSFCTKAKNFEFEANVAKVRPGWQIHHRLTGDTIDDMLIPFGDELFMVANDGTNVRVYDVTATGTSATTANVIGQPNNVYSFPNYMIHAGNLYIFDDEDNDLCYSYIDGVWYNAETNAGYNGTNDVSKLFQYNTVPQEANAAVSYRGRAYLFNGQYMYYSGIGDIGGDVLTRVDLLGVLENPSVKWAEVLTSPSGVNVQTLLAFGNEFGEIVCYAGDYPDAPNWEIVGIFKVPPLPKYNGRAVLRINNDVWIPTRGGLISLRKLFVENTDNLDYVSISGPVNPQWSQLANVEIVQADRDGFSSMAHWPEENKVYCIWDNNINDAGAVNLDDYSTIWVYNTVTGAWGYHEVSVASEGSFFASVTVFDNGLYMTINGKVMKLGTTDFRDENPSSPGSYTSYESELHSAYIDVSGALHDKIITGWDFLLRTGLQPSKIQVATDVDFNRSTSLDSTTDFDPAVNSYQRLNYGVGERGKYAQYRITITADDATPEDNVGFELYSAAIGLKGNDR
jgi:hypothetical protein